MFINALSPTEDILSPHTLNIDIKSDINYPNLERQNTKAYREQVLSHKMPIYSEYSIQDN